MTENCDICGKLDPNLVDYYAMLCPKCKDKYKDDIPFLKKIGHLKDEEEQLIKEENEKHVK